jgi:hypothetical protein
MAFGGAALSAMALGPMALGAMALGGAALGESGCERRGKAGTVARRNQSVRTRG